MNKEHSQSRHCIITEQFELGWVLLSSVRFFAYFPHVYFQFCEPVLLQKWYPLRLRNGRRFTELANAFSIRLQERHFETLSVDSLPAGQPSAKTENHHGGI